MKTPRMRARLAAMTVALGSPRMWRARRAPWWRSAGAFARLTSGLLPLLKVELLYGDNVLGLVPVPVGMVDGASVWRPSADADRLRGRGRPGAGEAPLSLRFTAPGGTWQLGRRLVDPYARR